MHWTIKTTTLLMHRFVILIATACCWLPIFESLAGARESTLEQRLQRKVSVTWRGQALAAAVTRLSRAGEIVVWIDRRVDRQSTVAIEVAEVPLETALRSVCREHKLGIAKLANMVYLGPESTANRLSVLLEEARNQARNLPPALKKRWLQAKPVEWPRLSEPRQLVENWLNDSNLALVGGEKIPHDLWPEQVLPPVPLIDRLALALAGFDLTCRISADGKRCEVVPLEPTNRFIRSADGNRSSQPQPIRKQSIPKQSRQVYTLRLKEKPLEMVLEHFAKQMHVEFVWPSSASEQTRQQLVSCDVVKADFGELLTAVLSDTGLQHRKEGQRVILEIKP